MPSDRKWRIYQVPGGGGMWKLDYPCGFYQSLDRELVVSKAEELWEKIYKEMR